MNIKYKIIPQDELQKHTREQVIQKVTHWFELKKKKYKRIADDENSELYTVTIYPNGEKTSKVKKYPLAE